MTPALTVKLTEEAFPGIVTEAGKLIALVLADNPIVVPVAGATPESVTVQVLLALADKDAPAHCSDERVTALTGDTRDMIMLWELPFREALITAV